MVHSPPPRPPATTATGISGCASWACCSLFLYQQSFRNPPVTRQHKATAQAQRRLRTLFVDPHAEKSPLPIASIGIAGFNVQHLHHRDPSLFIGIRQGRSLTDPVRPVVICGRATLAGQFYLQPFKMKETGLGWFRD